MPEISPETGKRSLSSSFQVMFLAPPAASETFFLRQDPYWTQGVEFNLRHFGSVVNYSVKYLPGRSAKLLVYEQELVIQYT